VLFICAYVVRTEVFHTGGAVHYSARALVSVVQMGEGNENKPQSDRARAMSAGARVGKGRGFLATAASVALGHALPALASAVSDANTKLEDYGLPPIVFVPPVF